MYEPLQHGKFYHIYNQGVSRTNLFETPDNYEYFLYLYEKHVSPVAETFAWCLLPNHFHLLVRIKEVEEISIPDKVQNFVRDGNKTTLKPPHQYFSNLFNSYSQAFNKQTKRRGTLFQRPFKRKLIEVDQYFTNLIVYIHNNPVNHGFVRKPIDWGWSSYLSYLSNKPTKIKRETVIEWFGGRENLKFVHNNANQSELMELFEL